MHWTHCYAEHELYFRIWFGEWHWKSSRGDLSRNETLSGIYCLHYSCPVVHQGLSVLYVSSEMDKVVIHIVLLDISDFQPNVSVHPCSFPCPFLTQTSLEVLDVNLPSSPAALKGASGGLWSVLNLQWMSRIRGSPLWLVCPAQHVSAHKYTHTHNRQLKLKLMIMESLTLDCA